MTKQTNMFSGFGSLSFSSGKYEEWSWHDELKQLDEKGKENFRVGVYDSLSLTNAGHDFIFPCKEALVIWHASHGQRVWKDQSADHACYVAVTSNSIWFTNWKRGQPYAVSLNDIHKYLVSAFSNEGAIIWSSKTHDFKMYCKRLKARWGLGDPNPHVPCPECKDRGYVELFTFYHMCSMCKSQYSQKPMSFIEIKSLLKRGGYDTG